jgi:hypothetical protein
MDGSWTFFCYSNAIFNMFAAVFRSSNHLDSSITDEESHVHSYNKKLKLSSDFNCKMSDCQIFQDLIMNSFVLYSTMSAIMLTLYTAIKVY